MKLCKCDRCKTEFRHETVPYSTRLEIDSIYGGVLAGDYDLCPGCTTDLIDFIGSYGKKKEE